MAWGTPSRGGSWRVCGLGSSAGTARRPPSADRYLVVSSAVAGTVRDLYGIEPTILPPPPAIDSFGPEQPVAGLEPGFWLCVSRLLPYKNVDAIVEAARGRADTRLVVVGDGPSARGSRRSAVAA